MLRSYARQIQILFVLADLILAAAATLGLAAVSAIDASADPLRLLALALGASLVWPPVLDHLGLYDSQRRRGLQSIVAGLLGAFAIGAGVIVALAWALGWPIEPGAALALGAAQIALLGAIRLAGWGLLRLVRRRGRNYRNVIILGTGSRARQVRDEIDVHPEWGLRILAFLDDCDVPVDPAIPGDQVHKFQDLPTLLGENIVDEALVACPRSLLPRITDAIGLLAEVGIPVTLLSDLFGDLVPPPRTTHFGTMGALSFAPVHHGRLPLIAKRLMDVTGAALFLVLSAPVLGLAAVLIKATSPGPVLFRQVRCGLRGRPFQILKLRTMHEDAEARRSEVHHLNELDGPVFKIRRDPRVTPVGRWLRRFSIDEIPQFWNVLLGDMSLVGPRPLMVAYLERYDDFQARRHEVRPGITGWAQVHGRNALTWPEKFALDVWYVDHHSLWLDALTLWKTVAAVVSRQGISHEGDVAMPAFLGNAPEQTAGPGHAAPPTDGGASGEGRSFSSRA